MVAGEETMTTGTLTDRLEAIETKLDLLIEAVGQATHRELTETARALVNEALSDYGNTYSDDFVEHQPADFVNRQPYTVRT
jgi:hypothetical protein